jgi:hypothetical protein
VGHNTRPFFRSPVEQQIDRWALQAHRALPPLKASLIAALIVFSLFTFFPSPAVARSR